MPRPVFRWRSGTTTGAALGWRPGCEACSSRCHQGVDPATGTQSTCACGVWIAPSWDGVKSLQKLLSMDRIVQDSGSSSSARSLLKRPSESSSKNLKRFDLPAGKPCHRPGQGTPRTRHKRSRLRYTYRGSIREGTQSEVDIYVDTLTNRSLAVKQMWQDPLAQHVTNKTHAVPMGDRCPGGHRIE